MPTAYDFTATDIDGSTRPLDQFRGKVLLIVNVASQCGFTPQYAGLEKLARDYGSRGLVVLGFPCDQFGHQEPGDEAEIKDFCSLRYDVTFPIKWNFTKFLVGRDGHVIKRYAPTETPASLAGDIEAALA